MDPKPYQDQGLEPWTADRLAPKSPYELEDGQLVECMPTGGKGSRRQGTGFAALDSDPLVTEAGVETGFSPNPHTLSAPGVAVGNVPDETGWVKGVPKLALEYADIGQDEASLKRKIAMLLRQGTRHIWVIRLREPAHVEVHEPGKAVRILSRHDFLTAPGILQNPVPVRALLERDAAHEVTLTNLLQRKGYNDLEAVRDEGVSEGYTQGHEQGHAQGRLEGRREMIVSVCELLEIELTPARQVTLGEMDLKGLGALYAHIKAHRAWPKGDDS